MIVSNCGGVETRVTLNKASQSEADSVSKIEVSDDQCHSKRIFGFSKTAKRQSLTNWYRIFIIYEFPQVGSIFFRALPLFFIILQKVKKI